jgi:hypothetical protein
MMPYNLGGFGHVSRSRGCGVDAASEWEPYRDMWLAGETPWLWIVASGAPRGRLDRSPEDYRRSFFPPFALPKPDSWLCQASLAPGLAHSFWDRALQRDLCLCAPLPAQNQLIGNFLAAVRVIHRGQYSSTARSDAYRKPGNGARAE